MAEWFAHTFPNVVYLGWTGEDGLVDSNCSNALYDIYFSTYWWFIGIDIWNWRCGDC